MSRLIPLLVSGALAVSLVACGSEPEPAAAPTATPYQSLAPVPTSVPSQTVAPVPTPTEQMEPIETPAPSPTPEPEQGPNLGVSGLGLSQEAVIDTLNGALAELYDTGHMYVPLVLEPIGHTDGVVEEWGDYADYRYPLSPSASLTLSVRPSGEVLAINLSVSGELSPETDQHAWALGYFLISGVAGEEAERVYSSFAAAEHGDIFVDEQTEGGDITLVTQGTAATLYISPAELG